MKKSLMLLLTFACLLILPAHVFAAPTASAIDVKQQLKIKDDRGKYFILHNAKQYRLKWVIEDPSRYQHFQAFQGKNGLSYFIAFDYMMAVDTNGKVHWKQPLSSELNRIDFVDNDNTFYRIYQGNMEYENETNMIIEKIERVDAEGKKTDFPSLTLYAPKDENGFSIGYPLYSGDAKGNLILLTGEGLASYRSDGSIGWRRELFEDGEAKLSAFDIINLFSDPQGNLYIQTNDRLLQLDDKGNIKWNKHLTEPGYYYMNQNQQLASWVFDAPTMRYRFKTYSIAEDGKIVPVPGSETILKGISDQRGGTYELDEKTNTVLNRDKTGKVKWRYSLTKKDIAWGKSLAEFTMTTDKAGNVYFSANVGTVYSLDPNGKPRFIVEMNNKYSLYSRILAVTEELTIIMIDNRILCIEKIK